MNIIFSKYKHALLIDDEDYHLIEGKKLHLWKSSSKGTHYVKVSNLGWNTKRFFLHRLVLNVTDREIYVDHKDGNPLNNQKANLRKCTPSQNSMNRGKTVKNIVGIKGVSRSRQGKYTVHISASNIKIHGGTFETVEEAALKYNELAREHHGEFAYQNPITATKYADGTMYTHEVKTPCSTPIRDKDFIIEQVRTFVPC